jgi:hypothetical protein
MYVSTDPLGTDRGSHRIRGACFGNKEGLGDLWKSHCLDAADGHRRLRIKQVIHTRGQSEILVTIYKI